MSQNPEETQVPEYVEPAPADPPQEIDRPAYKDAGDGTLNPGGEMTEQNREVLNAPVSED